MSNLRIFPILCKLIFIHFLNYEIINKYKCTCEYLFRHDNQKHFDSYASVLVEGCAREIRSRKRKQDRIDQALQILNHYNSEENNVGQANEIIESVIKILKNENVNL